MQKQLEFPFMVEDNLLSGKTCEKCKYQEECVESGATVSTTHTCGNWEYDHNRDQEQDSLESMHDFDQLMDKYSVSAEDRKTIYINCNHF
jgi:hypothetical protein